MALSPFEGLSLAVSGITILVLLVKQVTALRKDDLDRIEKRLEVIERRLENTERHMERQTGWREKDYESSP